MKYFAETIQQFDLAGTEDLNAISSLMIVTIGFICYHFISEHIHSKASSKTFYTQTIFQRLTGFLFLGVIPVCILFFKDLSQMKEIGITFNNFSTTIFSVLIIGSFILTGNYFIGKKKNNYLIYPQMRIEKWNTKFIFVNIITWMVYLLAYEIAFRGILLFPFIDLLGIELTIALNISIYALVHIPKGKKETLGAIPLGFVLCIITIETNSILSAWLIHVIMAVSNDIFALKANPKMQIQK
jgi:membrane protease YdiL (CAAX protease family)